MDPDRDPPPTNFINVPDMTGMRHCAVCHEPKPDESFEFKDKAAGRRGNVCYSCKGKNTRARIASGGDTAYLRQIKEKLAAIVTQLNADHPDVPSISAIMSGLLASLGGVPGLVEKWVAALSDQKATPKTRIDGFQAIAKFCIVAGEQNTVIAGLRNMSDDELGALAFELFGDELQKRGLRVVAADDDGTTPPMEGVA